MDRYQESSLYFLSLNCSWNFAKRIHPSMQSRTYFRYPTSCHCSHACSSWDSTRKYLQHPLAEIERDCRWADHTIPTSTAPPNSTHKHTHTQNTEGAQLLEREGGRESRGWGRWQTDNFSFYFFIFVFAVSLNAHVFIGFPTHSRRYTSWDGERMRTVSPPPFK